MNLSNANATSATLKTLPVQKAVLALGFFVLLFFSPQTSAEVSSSQRTAIKAALEKQLLSKEFTLRQSPNMSGTMYFHAGTNIYICWQKLSGLFPIATEVSSVVVKSVRLGSEEEVVGRKVDPDSKQGAYKNITVPNDYWLLTISHPYLGKGQIKLTTESGELPASPEDVISCLGFILKDGGLPQKEQFQVSLQSKMIHFSGSGHLPDPAACKAYFSVVDAMNDGFSPCPLCINRRLNLPNLEIELAIGRETEASLRYRDQFSKDIDLQAKVERAGRKVLGGWPLPLKGFTYRFGVLDNNSTFNAVACGGGYIFLYTGLLKALEGEDELEAVLAHEIAHVEQRHSIKEYMKAKKDANSAAWAALLFGAAAGGAVAASHNHDAALPTTDAVASLAFVVLRVGAQIALTGYSREHEIEADAYSLMYLEKAGKRRTALLNVVKKLRSWHELSNPPLVQSSFDNGTHPDPKTRLYILNNLEFRPLTENPPYDAYNKDGELLYSISLDALCSYTQRDGKHVYKVLSEIATTAALGDAKSVSGLSLRTGKVEISVPVDGVDKLQPLDSIGITFSKSGGNAPDLSPDTIPWVEGVSAERVTKRDARSIH